MKHRIVKEGNVWFQSTMQQNGIYFWKKLSDFEDIDEEGRLEITSKLTVEPILKLILEEMRANPEYKITWLDRQTFYENRVKYPMLWNAFIDITHS